MKSSLNELKKDLLGKLRLGMTEYGFDFHRRDMYFEKVMPGLRWAFNPGFIKHESDFDVIASVSVRLDSLERLVYEEDEIRSQQSYSLGAELGNISEGRQKRWTVATPNDVDPASQSLLDAFARIGLPYLEKLSVMETALFAVGGDDKTAWLHCPVHDERAKRALGLAFLLHKPDIFRRLADEKTAFLTNRNDPKLDAFLDFKRKLESRLLDPSQQ